MPIVWDASPILFSFGSFEIRWYGLLFALSFYFGLSLMQFMYKRENIIPLDIDKCLTYIMVGVVVGARLAHCIFYDPTYYFSHPVDVLKVWEGGLASHGGGVGLLIGLWLYCKQSQTESMFWMMDRLSLTILLGGSLIRFGNFMNSEIIGTPANVPWAIVFAHYDNVPRHPVQLYESGVYLMLFVILFLIYLKTDIARRAGMMMGFCMTGIFASRICLECFKERMASYDLAIGLSVGQMLSIPFLIVGIVLLYRGSKKTYIIINRK